MWLFFHLLSFIIFLALGSSFFIQQRDWNDLQKNPQRSSHWELWSGHWHLTPWRNTGFARATFTRTLRKYWFMRSKAFLNQWLISNFRITHIMATAHQSYEWSVSTWDITCELTSWGMSYETEMQPWYPNFRMIVNMIQSNLAPSILPHKIQIHPDLFVLLASGSNKLSCKLEKTVFMKDYLDRLRQNRTSTQVFSDKKLLKSWPRNIGSHWVLRLGPWSCDNNNNNNNNNNNKQQTTTDNNMNFTSLALVAVNTT